MVLNLTRRKTRRTLADAACAIEDGPVDLRTVSSRRRRRPGRGWRRRGRATRGGHRAHVWDPSGQPMPSQRPGHRQGAGVTVRASMRRRPRRPRLAAEVQVIHVARDEVEVAQLAGRSEGRPTLLPSLQAVTGAVPQRSMIRLVSSFPGAYPASSSNLPIHAQPNWSSSRNSPRLPAPMIATRRCRAIRSLATALTFRKQATSAPPERLPASSMSGAPELDTMTSGRSTSRPPVEVCRAVVHVEAVRDVARELARQERVAEPGAHRHGIVAVGSHDATPAGCDRGDGERRGADDINDHDPVAIDIPGDTAWKAIDDDAAFDAPIDSVHAGATGRRLSCANASECSPRR